MINILETHKNAGNRQTLDELLKDINKFKNAPQDEKYDIIMDDTSIKNICETHRGMLKEISLEELKIGRPRKNTILWVTVVNHAFLE